MEPIIFIDRVTGKEEIEPVYGYKSLSLLYGPTAFGRRLRFFASESPLFSRLYGLYMKSFLSKKKIASFIQDYRIDPSEFILSPEKFRSFNDFFIRHLKIECRPIDKAPLIIPADGRYYFFQNIDSAEGFLVKGKKFTLPALLQDEALADEYAGGSMVIARLCPTDYHRFHFPCDCIPGETKLINGYLYSVNPVAVKQNIDIFTQNKRTITTLSTEHMGNILFLEIGATNVGSIEQTFSPGKFYRKGEEKGFFSFGGSALILLFKPNTIVFSPDLIEKSESGKEIRCLLGQSMGSIRGI